MATILWSSLSNGAEVEFDPLVDILRFDDPAVSAAALSGSFNTDINETILSVGGKTITLGANPGWLTTTNVVFANGSELVIGDNSTGIPGTDTFDNTLVGGSGNDLLVALGGRDLLQGGAGNDRLDGGGGEFGEDNNDIDTLDGGSGIDTAVYHSNRAAYTFTKTASGYTVAGPQSSDTLSNVERLQLSDKKFALDLDLGAAAGNTVRIIGAAFDAPNIQQHPDWVGIGLNFFDGGKSMLEVCQLVVQIMGLSNTAFVTTVYTNVVGVAPSAADRDYFVGLLQGSGGTMTQADLLVLAANADINAQNINLVGLQASGVEFV